jgi:hypothetical protein
VDLRQPGSDAIDSNRSIGKGQSDGNPRGRKAAKHQLGSEERRKQNLGQRNREESHSESRFQQLPKGILNKICGFGPHTPVRILLVGHHNLI